MVPGVRFKTKGESRPVSGRKIEKSSKNLPLRGAPRKRFAKPKGKTQKVRSSPDQTPDW